jgi:hypothetical protein
MTSPNDKPVSRDGVLVPDGWVLVPVEPTPEMVEAGARSLRCDLEIGRTPQRRTASRGARNAYVSMLAARTQP